MLMEVIESSIWGVRFVIGHGKMHEYGLPLLSKREYEVGFL